MAVATSLGLVAVAAAQTENGEWRAVTVVIRVTEVRTFRFVPLKT
jgi:hypothetical protein